MINSHFVINLVIRKGDAVLLEQRNDSGLNWKIPGGHIEENETVLEACNREAMEELGINIKLFSDTIINKGIPNIILFLPNPKRVYIEYKESGSHIHNALVFFATTEDEPRPLEKQIIKWFTLEDLEHEESIISPVKQLAMEALNSKIVSVE